MMNQPNTQDLEMAVNDASNDSQERFFREEEIDKKEEQNETEIQVETDNETIQQNEILDSENTSESESEDEDEDEDEPSELQRGDGHEQSGPMENILAILRDGDSDNQLVALSELCEILAFSTEEISVNSFLPILIDLLNNFENSEIMLLAARCLTHICDISTQLCDSVVRRGAVPAFVGHLLTVHFIDLAEQSLQALEKISWRNPYACLRDGAFYALLQYLDFFHASVKRVALSTAANISKQISADTIDNVMESIPTLTTLLSDSDAKVVDHTSTCLVHIVRAAASSLENLERVSSFGLVSNVASLLFVNNSSNGQASLSLSAYTACIEILSTCVRGSLISTRELLEMGISSLLRDVLGSFCHDSHTACPLSSNRPAEQLYEIISLVNDLLPLLPYETISIPTSPNNCTNNFRRKFTSRNSTDNSNREKLFQEKPELLMRFGNDLLPHTIQVYNSSINTEVRHRCLEVISKLLCLSSADMLNILLHETNISRFLAGVLAGTDMEVLLPALQIAEFLMQNFPNLFSKLFMKGGFLHAVDTLISSSSTVSDKEETSESGLSSRKRMSDKEETSETGVSSRKRHNKNGRRKSEVVATEETKDLNARKACSSSVVVQSAKSDLKEIICKHARRFKETYFRTNLGTTEPEATDSLCKLTTLCKKLNDALKGKPKGKSKKNRVAADNNDQILYIAEILTELSQDDGMSKFEFIESGIVASLLNYLAGGDFYKGNMSQADLRKHQQETLKRFQSFIDLSLPLNHHGKDAPLTTLVRKLQDALASSGYFPVDLSQGPRSLGYNSSSFGRCNDSRWPLKLRLCTAQRQKSLPDHRSSILNIDPLANITDIEDYLLSKVQKDETESNISNGVTEPSTNTSTQSDVTTTQGHEEMLIEEPASVSLGELVDDVELRELVDASASASTSETTGEMTIQASIISKGPSIYRNHPRLNFFIGGKLLDRSSTIYQAIKHNVAAEADDPMHSNPQTLWDEVHTITYRWADAPSKRNLTGIHKMSSIPINNVIFIDNILERKLPCDLIKSDITRDILLLLRVVEELNNLAACLRTQSLLDAFAEGNLKRLDELKVDGPFVPQEEFLNGKLTRKLACQLRDSGILCSTGLPPWCHKLTEFCPFLFPFETRRQYFYSTALGMERAVHHLQQQENSHNPSTSQNRLSRLLQRQKVRVSRRRILESAVKVMELCCDQKSVLEIEYHNEVGSGLGPTLEFYTLISHEMQKITHGMWRRSSDTAQNGEFVQASLGLFPCPYPPDMDSSCGSKIVKVKENFCLLGRVMGKALQDSRLMDLPLSTAFYKLVLGKELDLSDIKSFDLELGTTLQEMQALVLRKQFLESMAGDKREEISCLNYRGARIEDLYLDFTLPGFPNYLLKLGGANISVSIDNLDEYVALVVDATIKTGIISQIEAFRTGFEQVLPISTLQVFRENELDRLLCGEPDLWVAETLTDHITFGHGYTAESPPILNFLEIMAELRPSQQRAFLQFITGSPRLPPGSLSALNPIFTVVRKNEATDADLPSVMTCVNYLKLPSYSTKEVMRDRLFYAITEGQGSFDLT